MAEETAAGYLDARIDALREHVASLAAALPGLPDAIARVRDQLAQEWQARGPGVIFGLIAGFVLLGFALEAAYRYWIGKRSVQEDSVRERLRSIALRIAGDAGGVAAFALGSAAAFLAFDWPVRTRQAVLGFLVGFIAVRIAIIASRALLSPRDARLRILPASDAEASFAHRRVALFAGWLAFGWVLAGWLALLGMDLASRQIVVYVLGLGLLAIAIEAVWRRSHAAAIALVLVWVLWVLQARGLFWVAIVALALPPVLRQVQAGADHVLRPAGVPRAEARGVLAAALGRGLRALAIIGAVFLLVYAFDLNVDAVAASESFWPRLARGALQALAIVLLADLAWLIAASLIDRNLVVARADADSEAETNRRARLRTLLPILRGTLALVLIVMTVLMALSALGIQVGPLLAGAGVVGVAVGFGAQTLVRDLFAKFSYLLDDAFRVGEYIESGNYKGTIEHLGGRSIRLRHHRGPIFTIPYGQLGAVKNSSRDWVIDKMTIGVTFDTDLDKARKLIKKIGQELAQIPEFAPNILEPLKMQGVEQFGDYAIQIRIKMMTRPNQQFTIRRRAYAMIKQAFDANGIRFARPTVQVAGGTADAGTVAAVRQGLEMNKAS
jgi:moderate conductance mechanosensitive channel